MRGLSALAVVVYHARAYAGYGPEATTYSGMERVYSELADLGQYGVSAFIVLSGFSLGISVARSGEDRIPKGFMSYIRRRAHRILPPYYTAYALFLLLIISIP